MLCDNVVLCTKQSAVSYTVNEGPLQFSAAKQACIDDGGTLAMPKNGNEFSAVDSKIFFDSGLIVDIFTQVVNCWIGIEFDVS